MDNDSPTPGRSANLPAGYDEDNPYEDEDLEKYPQWWQENVKEFQAHNMRPYRPPQFKDGSIVPELVNELQEQLGVDVKLQKRDPQNDAGENPHQEHDWDVLIDGERISTVPRYRAPEGYSVYDIGSDAFEEMVRRSLR